jgi:hypothetical protein
MALSSAQCRAGRALVKLTQNDLGGLAHVAKKTTPDFELEVRTPYPRTLGALRAALEAAGVEFIDENGGGAGVRLRRERGE